MKGFQLTKAQEKSIGRQSQERPLATLLEEIAERVPRKELVIKYALQDYQAAGSRLLECFATECRNKGSYAWIDGRVVKGSRYGGKYESNS